MSQAVERVADNELAFFFETSTDAPMPAGPLLFFISEVERIAKTKRHFGPNVIVDLIEVSSGSKSVRLSVNQKIAIAAVVVPGLGLAADLAIDICDRVVSGNGRLAQCVAEMSVNSGVISLTATGGATCRVVTRQDLERIVDERSAATETAFRVGKGPGLAKLPGVLRANVNSDNATLMGAQMWNNPQQALVGVFNQEVDDVVFITDHGDKFEVAGTRDAPIATGAQRYILLGRTGNYNPETGRRIFFNEAMWPLSDN